MDYKIEEITQHAKDRILESLKHDKDYLKKDEVDIHHDLFNTDYYIIGKYEAGKWLEDMAFGIIEFIKRHEMDEFGEVFTDFSSTEAIVNMYTYIIGEEIIYHTDLITSIKFKQAKFKQKTKKTPYKYKFVVGS